LSALERCPTGIEGFDAVTKGGFVRGSLILLAGNPGTGKSTFAAKFIHEGAVRYGEPGVYVSFAEPRDRFYAYMKGLGLNMEGAERRGLLRYLSLPTAVSKEALSSFIESILKAADEVKAKRIAIDSLTPFIQLGAPIEARALLHNTLMNLCSLLKATVLVVADLPFGEAKIGYGVEEFVADAVMMLKMEFPEAAVPRRRLELVKMRGVPLTTLVYEYSIEPGEGFVLHQPLSVAEAKIDVRERLSTGVEGLDAIFGGGIVRSTTTLIVGPSGSGKTLLALTMAAENAMRGLKVHYATFEEPASQVKATLEVLGYDPSELSKRGLTIASVPPWQSSPGIIRLTLNKAFIKHGLGRDLVVIDGVSALKRVLGDRAFLEVTHEAMNFFKSHGMTAVTCLAEDYFKERGATMATLMDNIVALRLSVEPGGLRRTLTVVKARMTAADGREHEVVLIKGRPVVKP
jgi:circadian clock protein KaiC